MKFFSQNRFTSAFSLLFATAPTTTATAATRPCKRKKAARFLLPPSGSRIHRSGKPKSLRCSFQSSGMFFIICAMDNPSGSAPLTIASTMSGARLFKPSTRMTYGGSLLRKALISPQLPCRGDKAVCGWQAKRFQFPAKNPCR